ncbi:putative membrane-anchored protein [Chitinophaga dinghuensis]|uniref:Putative membrane-anchored protein n=1 Tax=Chitinophaga dinghuensis TaxID=1539050 RepID=A0A327VTL4_9BACT|nr:DUF2167 domain-containing protein [Chitinophaga dinghuensis]RAJ77369.1 putative membrane-anchored protein [Chitinophaga dinghuensis]
MFKYLSVACLLFIALTIKAAPVLDSLEYERAQVKLLVDSIRKAQKYEIGNIKLPGGKAEIKVPAGFKYLNKEQSIFVLTKLWGNPESNAENMLGMIFPENSDPFSDSSFVFVVAYEEVGYIKDDDAEKINYDDLMKDMQKDEKEVNEARQKEGYAPIHLIGWAQPPFYDKQNKVLHWAKEIHFGDQEGPNTLNYQIRILGRHGILSLNAVCTMRELPLVKANIDKVLHMATFTEGNTYFDFDPKIDKVAAWTIGGLVAGKILAKVGLFAFLAKFLVAGWKFILLGLAALGGFIKKMLGRKKAEEPVVTEPAPTPEDEPTMNA